MGDELVASPDPSGGSVVHLRALGTTVTLALRRVDAVDAARAVLRRELEAIDRACSRFRDDSEIHRLYVGGGRPVPVGALLFEAVSVACDVAQRTGGAVDPTVGRAVEALGYDRDFAQIVRRRTHQSEEPVPAPGWWCIDLDHRERSVAVPPGVRLDLGATAKALVADRAARAIASDFGVGVLVCVGGDVAVAGQAPEGGWPVGIAQNSSGPLEDGPVVSILGGGLASSSSTVRSWYRGSRRVHHIVDPVTGDSASAHWRLVSTVGASCVDANAWSTAAVVWGEDAPGRLAHLGVPARFVRHDGVVTTVAGWPPDTSVGNVEDQVVSGVSL